MSMTKVSYLSCNVIFSQYHIFFLNLVDTVVAVMGNTPIPQVEIEEGANESTAL